MSEPPTREPPRRIKSIQTASDILRQIQYLSRPTLGEITNEVDVSKGTVHTYLETLEEEGFVTKTNEGYQLGVRLVTMGEEVRKQMELYRAGQDEVENLAAETGEWVHLTVESRGKEVAICQSRGDNAVAIDYHHRMRGSPQHLHYTASGKAILAFSEPERVEQLIEHQKLIERTPETITDPETLFAELEQIRNQGYAVNDEEEVRGMRSVGTSILGPDSAVCGAISVTAPTSRLSGERFETEIPELVMEAANIIEVNLETTSVEDDLTRL